MRSARSLGWPLLGFAAAACLAGPVVADELETLDAKREFRENRKWRMQLSPADDLYPRYIADPRRPGFTIARASFSESDIEGAGDGRYILRLGGRYGFLRFYPGDQPDRGFQIDAEGGFFGQFDPENSTDNIGWDGLYGLQIAWRPLPDTAFRFGIFHDSSHVGDEFAERTGRKRIDYTRQEYRSGVSHEFARHWRTYFEAGWAFDMRNLEVMKPWRGQVGMEYESPYSLWSGRAGWYTAVDVSSYDENDGDLNVTVQSGVMYRLRELGRTYRFGVELYDGRNHVGEFFQNEGAYVAVGFWFDL